MGIDRYMTIAEAIYYWDVSKYKLNKRLQDDEFIMPYVEEKLVKFLTIQKITKDIGLFHKQLWSIGMGQKSDKKQLFFRKLTILQQREAAGIEVLKQPLIMSIKKPGSRYGAVPIFCCEH